MGASNAVAYFVLRHAAVPGRWERFAIFTNEEVDIGRDTIYECFELRDRAVSNHHVRVRCVVYETQDEGKVAPLIYMRVLSNSPIIFRRNGLDKIDGGIAVDKHYGDILLNHGDHLQLTTQVSLEFRTMHNDTPNAPTLDDVRHAEVQRFADQYHLTKRVLGVGGYAAVFVAVKHTTGQQFACKITELPTEPSRRRASLRPKSNRVNTDLATKQETIAREYNVLKNLSHPNIITLEKVFRTSHNVYILQELVTGGDLLSYLDRMGPLSEPLGAMIVRQLLEAVKYLHSHQVVHRDIKPENILMTSWRDGARVVLTDFGQSRTITDVENAAKKAGVFRMQSVVGTYGYTAPEVYRRAKRDLQDGCGYSLSIDIWSIGCVAATLLTNEFIFPDGREIRLGSKTLTQFTKDLEVIDNGSAWKKINHRAKSFIRGCLATDESQRLTAEECLALPWFQHPHYRAEFDAAYKRAIQDWKPKRPDENIIEVIDTSDIQFDEDDDVDVRSQYLAATAPGQHASPPEMMDYDRSDSASPQHIPESPPGGFSFADSPIPGPPSLQPLATQFQPASQNTWRTQALPMPPRQDDYDDIDIRLRLAADNLTQNTAAHGYSATTAAQHFNTRHIARR